MKRTICITFFLVFSFVGISQHIESFYRFPNSEDSLLVKKNADLIKTGPNTKNEEKYFSVAIALWELKRNEGAKQMFLNIVNSNSSKYNKTKRHSSDIPGDTATNLYGYGSFTSNDKNSACLSLTKIFIEEQDYPQAYKYLCDADSVYQVEFTCGTGHYAYKEKLRNLYGLCYEGLGEFDKAIKLLLPYCFGWNNATLIRVLKLKYTEEELKEKMQIALESFKFELDDNKTHGYTIENFGKKNEREKKFSYQAGKGTVILFGELIIGPEPRLDHKDVASEEQYLNAFTTSRFYRTLSGYKRPTHRRIIDITDK